MYILEKRWNQKVGGYEVRQAYQTTALYLRFVACLASFSTNSLLPVSVIRMQNYRQRIVDDKSGRINFLTPNSTFVSSAALRAMVMGSTLVSPYPNFFPSFTSLFRDFVDEVEYRTIWLVFMSSHTDHRISCIKDVWECWGRPTPYVDAAIVCMTKWDRDR